MHLPHYYYLSPSQLQHLSFRVNIRRNNGVIQSKELHWQEHISNDDESETDVAIYSLRDVPTLEDDAKRQGRTALASRIHRDGEDPSSTMVIMARVGQHDVAQLCVIKMYNKNGMVSASPELLEGNSMSAIHSFTTPDQENVDYTVEMIIEQAPEDEGDCTLKGSRISEVKRHQLSWQEVDDAEHAFDYQTHVEIVSANGFTQPNILFAAPFGPNLVIRYKILKPKKSGRKQDAVVLKGSTNKLQSYDVFSTSIRFCVSFFVAFICIGITILYSLGMNIESQAIPAVLLAIIPLGLLCQFVLFGRTKIHHINHQFSLLFRKSCSDKDDPYTAMSHQTAMLEMNAYFHHNFGLISLAGSAVVPLPLEAGTYDINVPTLKPIAYSGFNERACRMQSYYLGTCLSEVQPVSELPSTASSTTEDGAGMDTRLLSKDGLITDGSGTIHLRVSVMKNYFNGAYSKGISEEQESSQLRMKVEETVDEVLLRVRRNKRIRNSRVMVPSSANPTDRDVARRSGRLSKIALSNEEKVDESDEKEETKQST